LKHAANDQIRHRWIAAHILPHEGEVRGWLRRHAPLRGRDTRRDGRIWWGVRLRGRLDGRRCGVGWGNARRNGRVRLFCGHGPPCIYQVLPAGTAQKRSRQHPSRPLEGPDASGQVRLAQWWSTRSDKEVGDIGELKATSIRSARTRLCCAHGGFRSASCRRVLQTHWGRCSSRRGCCHGISSHGDDAGQRFRLRFFAGISQSELPAPLARKAGSPMLVRVLV